MAATDGPLRDCVVHLFQRHDGNIHDYAALTAKAKSLGAKIAQRITKDTTHVLFVRQLNASSKVRTAEDADLRLIYKQLSKVTTKERRALVVSALWLKCSEESGTSSKNQECIEKRPPDPLFLEPFPNKQGVKRKRKSLRPREQLDLVDIDDAIFSSSQQIRELNVSTSHRPDACGQANEGPRADGPADASQLASPAPSATLPSALGAKRPSGVPDGKRLAAGAAAPQPQAQAPPQRAMRQLPLNFAVIPKKVEQPPLAPEQRTIGQGPADGRATTGLQPCVGKQEAKQPVAAKPNPPKVVWFSGAADASETDQGSGRSAGLGPHSAIQAPGQQPASELAAQPKTLPTTRQLSEGRQLQALPDAGAPQAQEEGGRGPRYAALPFASGDGNNGPPQMRRLSTAAAAEPVAASNAGAARNTTPSAPPASLPAAAAGPSQPRQQEQGLVPGRYPALPCSILPVGTRSAGPKLAAMRSDADGSKGPSRDAPLPRRSSAVGSGDAATGPAQPQGPRQAMTGGEPTPCAVVSAASDTSGKPHATAPRSASAQRPSRRVTNGTPLGLGIAKGRGFLTPTGGTTPTGLTPGSIVVPRLKTSQGSAGTAPSSVDKATPEPGVEADGAAPHQHALIDAPAMTGAADVAPGADAAAAEPAGPPASVRRGARLRGQLPPTPPPAGFVPCAPAPSPLHCQPAGPGGDGQASAAAAPAAEAVPDPSSLAPPLTARRGSQRKGRPPTPLQLSPVVMAVSGPNPSAQGNEPQPQPEDANTAQLGHGPTLGASGAEGAMLGQTPLRRSARLTGCSPLPLIPVTSHKKRAPDAIPAPVPMSAGVGPGPSSGALGDAGWEGFKPLVQSAGWIGLGKPPRSPAPLQKARTEAAEAGNGAATTSAAGGMAEQQLLQRPAGGPAPTPGGRGRRAALAAPEAEARQEGPVELVGTDEDDDSVIILPSPTPAPRTRAQLRTASTPAAGGTSKPDSSAATPHIVPMGAAPTPGVRQTRSVSRQRGAAAAAAGTVPACPRDQQPAKEGPLPPPPAAPSEQIVRQATDGPAHAAPAPLPGLFSPKPKHGSPGAAADPALPPAGVTPATRRKGGRAAGATPGGTARKRRMAQQPEDNEDVNAPLPAGDVAEPQSLASRPPLPPSQLPDGALAESRRPLQGCQEAVVPEGQPMVHGSATPQTSSKYLTRREARLQAGGTAVPGDGHGAEAAEAGPSSSQPPASLPRPRRRALDPELAASSACTAPAAAAVTSGAGVTAASRCPAAAGPRADVEVKRAPSAGLSAASATAQARGLKAAACDLAPEPTPPPAATGLRRAGQPPLPPAVQPTPVTTRKRKAPLPTIESGAPGPAEAKAGGEGGGSEASPPAKDSVAKRRRLAQTSVKKATPASGSSATPSVRQTRQSARKAPPPLSLRTTDEGEPATGVDRPAAPVDVLHPVATTATRPQGVAPNGLAALGSAPATSAPSLGAGQGGAAAPAAAVGPTAARPPLGRLLGRSRLALRKKAAGADMDTASPPKGCASEVSGALGPVAPQQRAKCSEEVIVGSSKAEAQPKGQVGLSVAGGGAATAQAKGKGATPAASTSLFASTPARDAKRRRVASAAGEAANNAAGADKQLVGAHTVPLQLQRPGLPGHSGPASAAAPKPCAAGGHAPPSMEAVPEEEADPAAGQADEEEPAPVAASEHADDADTLGKASGDRGPDGREAAGKAGAFAVPAARPAAAKATKAPPAASTKGTKQPAAAFGRVLLARPTPSTSAAASIKRSLGPLGSQCLASGDANRGIISASVAGATGEAAGDGGAAVAGAPALGQYPRGKDHPMRAGVRYLVHTAVDQAVVASIQAAVRKLGGARLCTPGHEDGHVTHLVLGDTERRTLKVLLGIANGALLVTPDWVTDSLAAEQWLSEEEYLVKGAFADTAAAVREQLQEQQRTGVPTAARPAAANPGLANLSASAVSAAQGQQHDQQQQQQQHKQPGVLYAKPLAGLQVTVHNAQCNGRRLTETQARKADVEKLVVALGGRVVPVRSAGLLIVVGGPACAAERRPRLGSGVCGAAVPVASEEWLMRLAETHVWQEPPSATG